MTNKKRYAIFRGIGGYCNDGMSYFDPKDHTNLMGYTYAYSDKQALAQFSRRTRIWPHTEDAGQGNTQEIRLYALEMVKTNGNC